MKKFLILAASAWLVAGCEVRDARANPLRIDIAPDESLENVRDRVRTIPAAEKAQGVEIVLAQGDYILPDGLRFSSSDSGASAEKPVVWRAATPGTVRILGAERIPPQEFRRLDDPELLARLPPEGRGKVWFADVSRIAPGKIAPMPASPAGAATRPLVSIGGKLATPARWPNGGEWASFTQLVDPGRQTGGRLGSFRGGAFVFPDSRASRWNFRNGVWLNGYLSHDWHNVTVKAASYGTENGTNGVLRIDDAAEYAYGVLAKTSGGCDRRRFRAINLFEELDEPGEWWLDRERKMLYIVPPGGVAPDGGCDVRIAFGGGALVSGAGVSGLVFEGIEFSCGGGTLAEFSGSEDVSFRNCRFTGAGVDGIRIDGMRNEVTGCEVSSCGECGIRISGGDRLSLTPSGSRVENCRISRFGEFRRARAPGISVEGCGIAVRRNEISDAPHSAVIYGGNEHLFEFNDVHHVMLETGDAGAFYTGRDWTSQGNVLRFNFIHESGPPGFSTFGFYFDDFDCGDAVEGNVFWKLDTGVFISGGRDHPVRRNVFAECRRGVAIGFMGMRVKDLNERGNGANFIDKAEAVRWKEEPWRSRYPNLARMLEDSPREPLHNPVEGNVFCGCREHVVKIPERSEIDLVLPKMEFGGNAVFAAPYGMSAAPDPRIAAGFDVRPADEDPGFFDAAHGDFRLKPGAPAAVRVPALEALPLGRICRVEGKTGKETAEKERGRQ